MRPSKKQEKQQTIRQALGTVIGFHGYLSNLRTCLQRTYLYKEFSTIERMHEVLREYEKVLRHEIKNL